MNIFRRIREWIFGKRIEDCIGVTVGGTSPLVFDGCNDSADIYALHVGTDRSVYVGGDFTNVKDVPDIIARWDGIAWAEASHIWSSPTDRYTYSITEDGITRDVSKAEFEAAGGHVNDYSRPITYWDLKGKWRCSYCGSTNTDNDMECRKCGAPERD